MNLIRAILLAMLVVVVFSVVSFVSFVSFVLFSSASLVMALLDVSDAAQSIIFKFFLPIFSIFLSVVFVVRKWKGVVEIIRTLSPWRKNLANIFFLA
jgi:hypothetical protein